MYFYGITFLRVLISGKATEENQKILKLYWVLAQKSSRVRGRQTRLSKSSQRHSRCFGYRVTPIGYYISRLFFEPRKFEPFYLL